MISAEGPPLLHTGALIDVMDALPHELRSRGHDVAVTLPYYREIRDNPAFKDEDTGVTVDVRVGDKIYIAEYLQGHSPSGVQLFFVSTALLMKITLRALFFSAKRRWNWRAV